MKIAIAGAGASGLAAAVAAAENGADVTLYESGNRCGRKILATGNGRCNLTNINAGIEHYHGEHPDFIMGAARRFWVRETMEFFENLGIVCRVEDGGRVYPYSSQASAVLDALRMRCAELGVKTETGFEVKEIKKQKNGFELYSYGGKRVRADRALIAAGGKAAPDLGSKGAGYILLKNFGHRITELRPSLVQIKTDEEIVRKLKGIKFTGKVLMGGFSESGEILFTDYGLSGPPIFALSAKLNGQKTIELDLMPEYSVGELETMLRERACRSPERELESFFTGMLNKKIGMAILKCVGAAPLSRKAKTLNDAEIKKAAAAIKGWSFNIKGTMSWNNAQVTKGGADTSEFDSVTMESKIVKDLYAAGEVLDIDGDCGGYNLQWAWSSGILAGRAMAK